MDAGKGRGGVGVAHHDLFVAGSAHPTHLIFIRARIGRIQIIDHIFGRWIGIRQQFVKHLMDGERSF